MHVHQSDNHATKNIEGPPCRKCKKPMALFRVEMFETYKGAKPVNVFRCEWCGRLAAVA